MELDALVVRLACSAGEELPSVEIELSMPMDMTNTELFEIGLLTIPGAFIPVVVIEVFLTLNVRTELSITSFMKIPEAASPSDRRLLFDIVEESTLWFDAPVRIRTDDGPRVVRSDAVIVAD